MVKAKNLDLAITHNWATLAMLGDWIDSLRYLDSIPDVIGLTKPYDWCRFGRIEGPDATWISPLCSSPSGRHTGLHTDIPEVRSPGEPCLTVLLFVTCSMMLAPSTYLCTSENAIGLMLELNGSACGLARVVSPDARARCHKSHAMDDPG